MNKDLDTFSILEEKEEAGSDSGDADCLNAKSIMSDSGSISAVSGTINPALMERKMAPTVRNSFK